MDILPTLIGVIESQKNLLPYTDRGQHATLILRLCIYQAFLNLTLQFPKEMTSYLVYLERRGGMQAKLFQEFVRILEDRLPYSFTKNKELYRITSLLDEQLNIFDGISIFDTVINDKQKIKNETKEFYIGGRKGLYAQPFFIGKLLDVIDINGKSLMTDVSRYSFSTIKFNKTQSGSKIRVSHLRVTPHYNSNAMAHLNRIRKKIVDQVREQLSIVEEIDESVLLVG